MFARRLFGGGAVGVTLRLCDLVICSNVRWKLSAYHTGEAPCTKAYLSCSRTCSNCLICNDSQRHGPVPVNSNPIRGLEQGRQVYDFEKDEFGKARCRALSKGSNEVADNVLIRGRRSRVKVVVVQGTGEWLCGVQYGGRR